jgi:hypothetical protein
MKTNIQQLRKRVRKMMIDADLSRGAMHDIARALGLNLQSLSMAMTGYRTGPRYVEILQQVKEHLETKNKKVA